MAAWAAGAATVDEAAVLSAHIEQCAFCREAFAHVVKSLRLEGPDPSPQVEPSLPLWSPVQAGDVLLGKYKVERIIGAGGMGVVVAARHLQLNERVALKFIRLELAQSNDVVSRFSREARAAARLKTAHVCRVYDLGVLPNGTPFMVMEYLEGESLEQRLDRDGPQPPERVKVWLAAAAEALAEAHGHGIVHRDLKPGNLFLARASDGSETLKVLDFGIAKSIHPEIEAGLHVTQENAMIGSPNFMAPEQLMPGARIDPRTDVWALGCAGYTLLKGVPPFQGADLPSLARQICEAEFELDGIASPLASVIARCLQKKPDQRFADAGQLGTALELLDAGTAGPPRTRPAVVAAVAVLVSSALALGLAWASGVFQPTEAAKISAERSPPPAPLSPVDSGTQGRAEAPAPPERPAAKAPPPPAKPERSPKPPRSPSVFGDRL